MLDVTTGRLVQALSGSLEDRAEEGKAFPALVIISDRGCMITTTRTYDLISNASWPNLTFLKAPDHHPQL